VIKLAMVTHGLEDHSPGQPKQKLQLYSKNNQSKKELGHGYSEALSSKSQNCHPPLLPPKKDKN
jgi:hypothetical protein